MRGAELRYSTYDKEMLGIMHALMKWRVYLYGKKFILWTDHDSLKYLQTQKVPSKRQVRWLDTLADFQFEI